MEFLQGNTYELPVKIKDDAGNPIDVSNVAQVQFVLGSLVKYYKADGSGEVDASGNAGEFIIKLSQEETFEFDGVIKIQCRVLFANGSVSGSVPKTENVRESITKQILTLEG